MGLFKVNIDGRKYEGKYRTAADAVFGLMRRDQYAVGEFTDMVIHIMLVPPEPLPKGYKRINMKCKLCESKLRHRDTKLCICKDG